MALDLFFNPFDWDKNFYNFNREEKDMNPYSIITPKGEGKIILVHNVLGIKKEDLKLTKQVKDDYVYLLISGKTKDKITGKEYTINSRFHIDDTEFNLDLISANMENGLLYVNIPYKIKQKQEPSEVQIDIG